MKNWAIQKSMLNMIWRERERERKLLHYLVWTSHPHHSLMSPFDQLTFPRKIEKDSIYKFSSSEKFSNSALEVMGN